MTRKTFQSFYPDNRGALECYDLVKAALEEFGILSNNTLLGAIATVRVEVGRSYRPITEIASGIAYEGRRDLGNFIKGDGVKFKGRGYLQLTGRANYAHYGKLIGVDLVSNPEKANEPTNSARILAVYFKDRNVNVACDKGQWETVRRLVNGGLNGYETFEKVIFDFKERIALETPPVKANPPDMKHKTYIGIVLLLLSALEAQGVIPSIGPAGYEAIAGQIATIIGAAIAIYGRLDVGERLANATNGKDS